MSADGPSWVESLARSRTLLLVLGGALGLAAILGFVVLVVVALSERPVSCACADGRKVTRWISGWQRDDRDVCKWACRPKK